MSNTQKNHIKIEIPCTPLVYAWLNSNYRKKQKYGNITLGHTSSFGKYFISLTNGKDTTKDKGFRNNYQKTVIIHLNESIYIRYGYLLSPTDIININSYVTQWFYDNLVEHVHSEKELKGESFVIKTSLERFFNKNALYNYELCYLTVLRSLMRKIK